MVYVLVILIILGVCFLFLFGIRDIVQSNRQHLAIKKQNKFWFQLKPGDYVWKIDIDNSISTHEIVDIYIKFNDYDEQKIDSIKYDIFNTNSDRIETYSIDYDDDRILKGKKVGPYYSSYEEAEKILKNEIQKQKDALEEIQYRYG